MSRADWIGVSLVLVAVLVYCVVRTATNGPYRFRSYRVLAAAATEDIDLATLRFAKVTSLRIRAGSGNAKDLVLGSAPASGFIGPFGWGASTVRLRPGGEFKAEGIAGWAVNQEANLLHVSNSAPERAVTYDIDIVGVRR